MLTSDVRFPTIMAIDQKLREATHEVRRRRKELRISRLALEVALLKRTQLEARRAALTEQPADGVQLDLNFTS